ncbi:MAG: hypothetical protein RXR74_02575 [Nitrososphaeria archaeon]
MPPTTLENSSRLYPRDSSLDTSRSLRGISVPTQHRWQECRMHGLPTGGVRGRVINLGAIGA